MPDEVTPPAIEIRASVGERLGVAAAALTLIALALAAIIAAAALWSQSAVMALTLGATALVIGSFAGLVSREAVARARFEARLEAGRLSAILPRRRGFTTAGRETLALALGDIDRIETRQEVFSSLGVTTGQRAYVLVLKDGARKFLGADRDMLVPHFGRLADAIAAQGRARIVDRGMIDGDAGFALIAGASVPDWHAAPLSQAEAARREKARGRTPALLLLCALLVILARAFGG